MPIAVPGIVLDLATESGAFVGRTPDRAGLDIGDGETSDVVRRVDGVYQVEEVERGRVQRRVLRTSEESALHRYLALSLAVRWRSANRLGVLTPVERPLPDGMRVELSGPRNASLRWVEDGVERRADDLVPHRADDLARTLLHPLEVVVSAVRDPSGAPVFT